MTEFSLDMVRDVSTSLSTWIEADGGVGQHEDVRCAVCVCEEEKKEEEEVVSV